MKNLESMLSTWLMRHRWWFLVPMPSIVPAPASGIEQLKFTPDYI